MEHINFKVPVVLRDDYVMYLERYNDLLWFHTDIKKWTGETKKKYKGELYRLLDLVGIPLLAYVKADDWKLAKFGETLGWEQKDTIMQDNKIIGYIYGLGY